MIHATMYTCGSSAGYALGERTPDFPEDYLSDILPYCTQSHVDGGQNTVPIGFCPLRDRYLIRCISYNHNRRSFHEMLLILLEQEDADQLLELPFSTIKHNVTDVFRKVLQDHSQLRTNPEMIQTILQPPVSGISENSYNLIDDNKLLYGAMIAGLQQDVQVFYGLRYSPDREIAKMIIMVPPYLRRQLSFQTGLQDAIDSNLFQINFTTEENLKRFEKEDFHGCLPRKRMLCHADDCDFPVDGLHQANKMIQALESPKIWKGIDELYPVLWNSIENWNEYQRLVQETNTATREQIFCTVKEKPLYDELHKNLKLSEELRRIPIKQVPKNCAVRKYLKNLNHQPNKGHHEKLHRFRLAWPKPRWIGTISSMLLMAAAVLVEALMILRPLRPIVHQGIILVMEENAANTLLRGLICSALGIVIGICASVLWQNRKK